MAVNVKLLRKVRKLIAEEPRRLRMKTWGMRKTHILAFEYEFPPCGTVACLAGWTVLAAQPKAKWKNLFRVAASLTQTLNSKNETVPGRAAKLLGLPAEKCPFNETHWGAPEVLNWIDEQIAKAK